VDVNRSNGSYGNKSPEMTTALRERLERLYGRTSDETGTFWMAWHDFLRIFSQVDVCKAHRVSRSCVIAGVSLGVRQVISSLPMRMCRIGSSRQRTWGGSTKGSGSLTGDASVQIHWSHSQL
jgi:hypothetical protein